jgi:hypothetical protein
VSTTYLPAAKHRPRLEGCTIQMWKKLHAESSEESTIMLQAAKPKHVAQSNPGHPLPGPCLQALVIQKLRYPAICLFYPP